MIPTVCATRYVAPLREGGSLPGIVEADDLGTYVAKFTGAGQGPKALVAEIVAGEIGRRLGLRVPELVVLELDPVIARSEPDWEVQELLARSGGDNLGLDFLPGAIGFDPVAHGVDPIEASDISRFDAERQEWVVQGGIVEATGEQKRCRYDPATSGCQLY